MSPGISSPSPRSCIPDELIVRDLSKTGLVYRIDDCRLTGSLPILFSIEAPFDKLSDFLILLFTVTLASVLSESWLWELLVRPESSLDDRFSVVFLLVKSGVLWREKIPWKPDFGCFSVGESAENEIPRVNIFM